MQDSEYQIAVFNAMASRKDNLATIAVAGSGKTHTAVKGLEQCSAMYSVLLAAFNVDIRDAFKKKTHHLRHYVRPINYNGFGWGICLEQMRSAVRLDEHKTRNTLQHYTWCPKTDEDWKEYNKTSAVYIRLVSLFKNLCLFTVKEAAAQLEEIKSFYAITEDINEEILFRTYEHVLNNKHIMDFDDQKFMPLKYEWPIPCYDTVVVDEFQDTCELEFQLMRKASEGGRFYCFGDPDQSIYGFKGSTPDAFKKYCGVLGARELPLSICYRCPLAVIRRAQQFVPRIQAAPGAIEGSESTVQTEAFVRGVQPGDFVLCRTTEPLIKRCLQGIANRVPGKVRGREIGDQLLYTLNNVSGLDSTMSTKDFASKLMEYQMTTLARLSAIQDDNSIRAVEDRCRSLRVIAGIADTVGGMQEVLASVFTDKPHEGVDYMTIHKSKGLQAKRVWVLRPDLLPHPRSTKQWMIEEERRLAYVACTRSEDQLRYVQREENEK